MTVGSPDWAKSARLWTKLIDRFTPDIDWSGLDAKKHTFWHQQSHIFQDLFYYIESTIAQLEPLANG